jgi:hypothetical protein
MKIRKFSWLWCPMVCLCLSSQVMADNADSLKEAWENYYASLDQLRVEVEQTQRFGNTHHRPMAYYSILEAQAMVYNWVIAPRLDNPRIFSATNWNTYLYTLGQNNPDSQHAMMTLDGRQSYRLTGRVGDLKVVALKVYNDMLGQPDTKDIGDYDISEFADQDGRFEIVFSAREQEGNWIKIDGNSQYNFILLRRYFGDWFDDLGELRLERMGNPSADTNIDEQGMVDRLNRATNLMGFFVRAWNIGFHDTYIDKVGRNELAVYGGESLSQSTGSRLTTYALGIFDCPPGDAIVIETEVPDAAYWSFQLGDVWAKPLNFMRHQTDVNIDRAFVNDDGKVRLVISHQDPGIANWLDPMGHGEVLLAMRVFKGVGAFSKPEVRRVKASEILSVLPQNTPVISTAERQKNL